MRLWIDDVHLPPSGDGPWLIATTYELAIRFLEMNIVTMISFDHDLGQGKTGYDVIKWIEEQAFFGKLKVVPKMVVHSANPVGRANIERAIEAIGRRLK